MENEESGLPRIVTLSATGLAREEWPRFLGDYSLTERQHLGRPVYSNSEGRHLYSLESGAWALGWVGARVPAMRSSDQASGPALCQLWQYRDYKSSECEYQDGDISVTVKK